MFGLVTASLSELSEGERQRYQSAYCGICRGIRDHHGQLCRLGLSYDMAFLALLLMSLYEPEEVAGANRCPAHPGKPKPWVDNAYIRYAAHMNVALACYKARDDWQDDRKLRARALEKIFGKDEASIAAEYPRQCQAIADCIRQLSRLEAENCQNPDEPANVFGNLMAELLVWQEDMWAEHLRQVGFYLGRFIYLADAAIDFCRDKKAGKYNPFSQMGENHEGWEQILVLAMAACTDAYERLPLVQDKHLLDNILYSGVWLNYRTMERRKEARHGRSI